MVFNLVILELLNSLCIKMSESLSGAPGLYRHIQHRWCCAPFLVDGAMALMGVFDFESVFPVKGHLPDVMNLFDRCHESY